MPNQIARLINWHFIKTFLKTCKKLHFLDKCYGNSDGKTVIATFDVVGIYTNIPHTFWLDAVRYFLLKHSTCVFDNEYFLQLQGAAMGTVFDLIYANPKMGYHKIKVYDLIELNYNLAIRQYFVRNWKRFLDDC